MTKKPSCNNIDQSVVYHGGERNRRFVECLYGTAEQAIGEITPGCEIFGFTKGQFSLMDVIAHILSYTGPASVDISTWTAGKADISHAEKFLHDGHITSARWIVDRSFPSRQKEYFKGLIKRFGPESIRMTRTHAKFCLIKNEDWKIVLRSSMNLNRNPRFENFEISDDPSMCEFFTEMVDAIFSQPDVGRMPTTAELDEWFKGASIRGESYDRRDTSLPSMGWL